jgi:glycosyltransferase involved in cell wall biosynthesis
MLTYNREKFVERAIKSVLAQTFRDFEYIIVDNGSTDRSGTIADEYAARDGRIRVIHRERGHIGSGRNSGLNAARGEWITYIDDDDWCEPDFLEFLYALVTANDADIAICGSFGKAFDQKCVMSGEESVIRLLWRNLYNIQFPTKFLRRELFDGAHFSESAKYDDIELLPKILAGANRVVYHGLPKYTFYRHDGNNSAWTTNHSLLDGPTLREYLSVYRNRTKWLSAKFPDSIPAWRYFEWSFMISMVEKVARLGLNDCEEQAETLKQKLAGCRDEFLSSPYILDFEKDWMARYVPPEQTERN